MPKAFVIIDWFAWWCKGKDRRCHWWKEEAEFESRKVAKEINLKPDGPYGDYVL